MAVQMPETAALESHEAPREDTRKTQVQTPERRDTASAPSQASSSSSPSGIEEAAADGASNLSVPQDEEGMALEAQRALEAFYEQLGPANAEEFWRKRGLLPETVEGAGIRANTRGNQRILEGMRRGNRG